MIGNKMNDNFYIKTMSRSELDFAINLAAEEGWNPGLHDTNAFFDADKNGFLIGYLNEKPIGCISAVSYNNKFGFIGFYIIIPEYRGKGYGIKLWKAAMDKLKNHNIGLDGVIEQQENYKKSGFKLAYSNIRYEWTNFAEPIFDERIINISQVPFNTIKDFDRKFFPEERSDFLKSWLDMPESFSYAYITNNQINGYGVIRKCRSGYKIGPLFSESIDIAEKLFLKLCSSVESGLSIYLDVPEVNSGGILFANKYKMKKVFGTARMYTEKFPELPLNKIFGVTTFELG